MSRILSYLSFPLKLFLLQFALIFACALGRWKGLTLWDGEWYAHILRHGYSATLSADPTVPDLGNVGFFPGYPLAGWCTQKLVGGGLNLLSPEAALLIVSFVSVLLIWHLLSKWAALFQPEDARPKIILLALYPFSIFFYYAYSEASYCIATLAFFYYSELFLRAEQSEDSKAPAPYLLYALFSGILMNSTRLFGVVFSLYPLIRAIQLHSARPSNALKLKALALVLGSFAGLVGFFIYCQIKFQAWDFYFISKRVIWGNIVNLHKFLPPSELFNFSRPLRADTTGKYIGIALGVYLTYRLIKLIQARDFKNPLLALTLVSGMYWGETLLAMTSWNFSCLGRYLLPLLVLQLPFFDFKPRLNWKWGLVGLIFLGLQIAYALKFARYGWVA